MRRIGSGSCTAKIRIHDRRPRRPDGHLGPRRCLQVPLRGDAPALWFLQCVTATL